ncbi:hypothetical protein [Bosea sp. (in: a-proteobacteria)]|uniref:hypothetical protein n=1 Tax=Bosea sp. (in: a-proteobacteria) TaxID=1871050 RepID=UPI003B3BC4FE
MSRPISDAWFFRIKAATRDLITRCGGVVRAGEIANASKSEVSRWQSTTDPDIISIPEVLALEAECGAPLVTAVMADLHGRRLADEAADPAAASNLFRDHAELMRHSAEVQASMSEALADGTVTPAEAERVDRDLRTLDATVDKMRGSLATVRSAGSVVPLKAGR